MNRSNADSGIAIVSVLLVMVAVMLLGLGTMFLTQMNLGIAQNVKANALAEDNANSGLNAALIAIQDYYNNNNALPASLTLPSISAQDYSPSYSLAAYDVLSPDSASVSVKGSAADNAEHIATALVTISAKTELPPYFGYGLSTEGVIDVTGNAAYVNAGIHANKGYEIIGNQNFYTCVEQNDDGTCADTEKLTVGNVPLTASPGAKKCSVVGNNNFGEVCKHGVPVNLTDSVTITPDYAQRVSRALDGISHEPGTPFYLQVGDGTKAVSCDEVDSPDEFLSNMGSLTSGTTVCVNGNLNLSGNNSLSNINLVVHGDISFTGNWTFNNVTIISDGSPTITGNTTLNATRLFTQGDIRVTGNNQFKLTGETTLATGGDLELTGNSIAMDSGNSGATIQLVLIAQGNMRLTGNSRMVVAAVAGGTFTKTGNAEFYGRVASKGELDITGNFHINSSWSISNDDAKEKEPPVLQVVSRR